MRNDNIIMNIELLDIQEVVMAFKFCTSIFQEGLITTTETYVRLASVLAEI